MFKNYLKTASRNIVRFKMYSFINILGLALGIACAIIIFSYIHHEMNYDNYHQDSERIYRVEFFKDSFVGQFYSNSIPGPVGPLLAESSSIVEKHARLIPPFENSDNVMVVQDQQRFFETDIYFADPQITDIFSFNFLEGSPNTALDDPNSVIITKSIAEKYFGEEYAIGMNLNIEIDYDYYCPVAREDFMVTAIIADTPSKTHCPIKMLLSMNSLRKHLNWIDEYWMDHHSKYTYIKLMENTTVNDLEKPLQELVEISHEKYKKRTGREWKECRFYLQPIKDIHMDKQVTHKIIPAGNWYYIHIYSIIAIVVLLIGCLNFINISVSIGMKNIKQLGMRKIIGAGRHQLILQCFTEVFVYLLFAFMLAFCLIELLLPFFNQLANVQLKLTGFLNFYVLLSTCGLFLIVALLSGSYNAFVLTNYKPFNLLKGNFSPNSKGSVVQRFLVVIQFTVILALLTSSIIIYKQLQYMCGSSLGFDKEQKIVIPFKTNLGKLRQEYENIKTPFISHPDITGATVSSGVPGDMSGGYYMKCNDIPDAETKRFQVLTTDTDFINEFKLNLLAGRQFEKQAENGYIINETGVKFLGFSTPWEVLGKELWAHYHGQTKKVIGVISDFHFKGMQEQIQPLVLDIETSLFNTLTLSVNQGNLPNTIKFIGNKFEELFPGTPFSFSFLDEDFDKLYKHESQIGLVVGVVALLGIAIAAFGLFGLVSFFIMQKTKEIGIRKVLGSSIAQLVTLFSSRYVRLIFISILLAFPLSWFADTFWLQNFAYRININVLPFILSGLIVILISISVVLLRCLKAANANPVVSLKYE